MLAGLTDWIHLWQMPLFVVLAIGWLGGGGWLLLRSLKKSQYPKKIKLPQCILIFLVAGMGGGAVAMVVFFLFYTIGEAIEVNLKTAGLGAAVVALFATTMMVIFAMLELSLKEALKAARIPLLGQLVLMAAIGAAAILPVPGMLQERRAQRGCNNNLVHIADGLQRYQSENGVPPTALQALVDEEYIEAKHLQCPSVAEQAVEYFYSNRRMTRRDKATKQMVVCDKKGNHGEPRNVLFTNGNTRLVETEEFEVLIALEENEGFVAALRAAEGDE